MTAQTTQPEWRRSKADAVIDGEAMVNADKWANYKLKTTYFDQWSEVRNRWWKAVPARKENGS